MLNGVEIHPKTMRSLIDELLSDLIATLDDAETGSVLIRNQNNKLSFIAVEGYDLEKLQPVKLNENQIISKQEGINKISGKKLNSWNKEHFTEQQYNTLLNHGGLKTIKTIVSFPILVHEKVLGEFNVENHQSNAAFDIHDLKTIENYKNIVEKLITHHLLQQKLVKRTKKLKARLTEWDDLHDTYSHNLRNILQIMLSIISINQNNIASDEFFSLKEKVLTIDTNARILQMSRNKYLKKISSKDKRLWNLERYCRTLDIDNLLESCKVQNSSKRTEFSIYHFRKDSEHHIKRLIFHKNLIKSLEITPDKVLQKHSKIYRLYGRYYLEFELGYLRKKRYLSQDIDVDIMCEKHFLLLVHSIQNYILEKLLVLLEDIEERYTVDAEFFCNQFQPIFVQLRKKALTFRNEIWNKSLDMAEDIIDSFSLQNQLSQKALLENSS